MKTQCSRNRAFTLVELVLVVVVLGLLATLVLRGQGLTESRVTRDRIVCANNLKQVGLAFRMWSNDHEENFPWRYDAAKQGTREAIEKEEPWRHFLALTNELPNPKVLACPADDRRPVTNYLRLAITNVSYFVGLDADEILPRTILSGDRNVTNGIAPKKGVMELTDTPPAGWTEHLHNGKGNIGFGDGSVSPFDSPQLRRQITAANDALKTGKTRVQLPLAATTP